ncbi:hypothetical protein VKT23_006323 [Stygiomarasmius scandens]|uniref:Uncharacterized protein n=1 Tax=Marasmiellus scandens TaxID=2682957 RepID=A0ABR1JS43_9AGAR
MAEESAAVPTLRDGVEEIDEKHSDSLEADKGIPVGKDLIQIVKTTGDVGEVFADGPRLIDVGEDGKERPIGGN